MLPVISGFFCQAYGENYSRLKDLNTFQVWQKSQCKVGAKKSTFLKRLKESKKLNNVWNKPRCFSAIDQILSLKWVRCKGFKSWEASSNCSGLDRATWERKCFCGLSCPATAQTDSRPWHCLPHDSRFVLCAVCRSSRRISSRFQRKIWEARQYVGELEFCRQPERAVCEVVEMKS